MSVSVIIILIMFTDTFIQKTYSKFSRLEKEVALNEKKLFRLKEILKREKELDSEYERIVSRYKKPKDSDNLLQDIENVAKRLNVNILNIKPTVTKDEGKYKTYLIKIESQDDISTFAKFLYTLTEELKRVGVERLQINAQGRDELPKIVLLLNAVAFKE